MHLLIVIFNPIPCLGDLNPRGQVGETPKGQGPRAMGVLLTVLAGAMSQSCYPVILAFEATGPYCYDYFIFGKVLECQPRKKIPKVLDRMHSQPDHLLHNLVTSTPPRGGVSLKKKAEFKDDDE